MKYPIRPLFVLALGALTACGGSTDEAPAPTPADAPVAASESAPAQAPAPADAPTAPVPQVQGEIPEAIEALLSAQATPERRSVAEVTTPFAFPEEERTNPAPYRPDLALEMKLVAGGEEIPLDEVKRHLCLGYGFAYSDFVKFAVLIDQELERRKAAGEDLSKYEVSEEDLAQHLAKQRADFALRYPTLDFELEVGRAYIAYDIYREPARQSIVFDRLFLPEDPAEWPELTIELVRGFGGEVFVQDAFDSYERRKQYMIDQGLDEIPPEDMVLLSTYKDIILRNLSDFAQIETNPGRLPAGVLMIVEGKEIPISAVWDMIGPHVSAMDLDYVRRFLVLCKLLEKDLAATGALLSQEDFEATWPEEGMTYRQKLDQYMVLAQQTIGLQSTEAYALYSRLIESLRSELGDQLEDEALLREWSPITNEVTGASKRDIEMILCSAWDGDLASWKPEGWVAARRKAWELRAGLDAGADWTALRELHSEFWDPPMPEIGNTPMFGLRYKGAFGTQTRNQLMNLIAESEGHAFVYGKMITDTVFYEQEVNQLLGPRMGPKGYYLLRLTGRTPPMRPLDLSTPLHRQLIQSFYLRVKLGERAHELLRQGLEDGSVQGL